MLGFIWIFIWPFLLPLICIGVLSATRRERLLVAAAILTALTLVTAAPLIYGVLISRQAEGLAVASLVIYPASLAAIAATLLVRGFLAWVQTSKRG